eukprot:2925889-Prymnesium_polylepis.1
MDHAQGLYESTRTAEMGKSIKNRCSAQDVPQPRVGEICRKSVVLRVAAPGSVASVHGVGHEGDC